MIRLVLLALISLLVLPLSALADISGPPAPDPVVEPAPPEVVVAPVAPAASDAAVPVDVKPDAPPTPAPEAAPAAVVTPPAVIPAPKAPAAAPALDAPKVTAAEVMEAATEAVSAGAAAFDKPTLVSIAAFVSALLWALLAALRRWGGAVSTWLTGKRIRWITLIVAPVATMAGAMGAGVGWFDALVMACSGPGALFLNEFGRAFKGSNDG